MVQIINLQKNLIIDPISIHDNNCLNPLRHRINQILLYSGGRSFHASLIYFSSTLRFGGGGV